MTEICTRNTRKLSTLSNQFFEMTPVRRIQWQNADIAVADVDVEAQRYLLDSTVNSQLCQDYPPSLQYQRAFVKKLLTTLELHGAEICDELYETYTGLLAHTDLGEEDTLCYKTYTLDEGVRITIQESVNMISCGTTGLNTWQAAQHLAEWAVQNKQLLENRHILELGCGLGLTGIAVCKVCCVDTYTFTDCHTQVLDCLARNLEHNFCDSKLAQIQCGQIEKVDHEPDGKKYSGVKGNGTLSDCDIESSCDTKNQTDYDSGDTQSMPDCVTNDSKIDCVTSDSKIDCDTNESGECYDTSDTRTGLDVSSTGSSLPVQCVPSEVQNVMQNDEIMDPWTGVTVFEINKPTCCKRIQAVHLDWENVDQELIDQLSRTNVIIAADVVYDTRIIPALVSVLKCFLGNQSTHPVAYIASTIRNEDTRDQFLIALSNEGLKYDQVDPPTVQLFHYDRSLPIEIIRVTATV